MAYDFKEEESKWQEFWKNSKIYVYEPQEGKEDYVIDTPPPTLSGSMHIGHAFSYSQQDFVARYKRMAGLNVCYPFGTDDNGLPTERLVEKEKKVRSTRMDRQEFIALCDSTIKELKPQFIQDWINIGMSCDFEGSYSTIDEHSIVTSQASFIDLFEKQRVFTEDAPVSWCPSCQTAIAQAEFESVDMKSHFNDIIFKVGGKDLIVATTRPELLSSCVAIFVHPEDKRYTDFVGKSAKVPLCDFEVPIITDEKADPQKGTGVVMCCTFGDQTDVEWWRSHKLPLKVSITPYGSMNERAGKYEKLKIKDARKQIIEDLKEAQLLINQKDIVHPVNTHERCGNSLEILKTKQWFIKVLDKKEELIEAGEKINWYPNHMNVRYKHWVENLNWDWCISRQRHFGIPFPVWYEKDTGKVIVASKNQLPCDPSKDKPKGYEGNLDNLIPESDVMDTWATSSVTPQIITNWVHKGGYNLTPKQYPTALRAQAHDIIRTWAFYTIVKGMYNNQELPWKDIIVSGHLLDPRGNKMSKSKGNGIDPKVVIEKYGADAFRFFAASAKMGEDVPFQEKDVQTGKKTVNKLANSASFTAMHLEDFDWQKPQLQVMDKWLLSKLQHTIKSATQSFEKYEYVKCKMDTEKLFWQYFCDNYLEICKDRVYNPDRRGVEERKSAQYTLNTVLLNVIKLFAPIMPHITESIYQEHYKQKEGVESIHLSLWPKVDESMIDIESEQAGDCAVAIIAAVRKYKSEQQASLKIPITTLSISCDDILQQRLESVMEDLKAVTNSDNIVFGEGDIETGYEKVRVKIVLGEKQD